MSVLARLGHELYQWAQPGIHSAWLQILMIDNTQVQYCCRWALAEYQRGHTNGEVRTYLT